MGLKLKVFILLMSIGLVSLLLIFAGDFLEGRMSFDPNEEGNLTFLYQGKPLTKEVFFRVFVFPVILLTLVMGICSQFAGDLKR